MALCSDGVCVYIYIYIYIHKLTCLDLQRQRKMSRKFATLISSNKQSHGMTEQTMIKADPSQKG
jgi:hypothetical protein